uniref:Ribonuclease BN, tRNA processing enzyme n=1 Tax=Candidatus Kentrum sp. TC TaxID=2126339 RepID=A0A450ZQ47_9GAMM|nr:MAG: Ribonuclease BN, tRNA processing enzyme [Candidatus Kentron sp. TC]VFK46308.1 MAG: Ribonuclease BN, tRNA processing enzyme [Candidatus Kentron sp. TC]VFK55952.1 MAG: Ribonuclease BN, tRNA processing enzyme [Candidatus Kentron sp. TC]
MTQKTQSLSIVFYGTAGWFDDESGCTNCVGIFPNETDIILFDMGTGAGKIKKDTVRGKNLTLVLSHLHLDHCYGLHLFPLFQPASLTILIHEELKLHLESLFSYPFMRSRNAQEFPIDIRTVCDSRVDFTEFFLETKALKHNTPVIGARLQCGDASVSYCVDSMLCDNLLEFARDCDILIIESGPHDDEKTKGAHLGLSDLRTVLAATSAGKVIVTHFAPVKYPNIESRALLFSALKGYHDNIVMAHDGLTIRS